MVFLVGLVIACFLVVLLLLKKGKKSADYILMTWIGVMIGHIFLFYIRHTGIDLNYPYTLGLLMPLPVLHGVLLYFYTIETTRNDALSVKKIFLHLIPFLILVILAIPFYALPAHEKIVVFQNEGKGFEWYTTIQIAVILISGFSYSIATVLQIRKHRKSVQHYLSNIDKVMLTWLEYLAIGLGIIWLLALFFNEDIIFTGVVIFVLFIGFFGINQAQVFNVHAATVADESLPDAKSDPVNVIEKTVVVHYAKSGLNEEDASAIMQRLDELMKTKKLFKENSLTLDDLAIQLDVPPNQLSQALNSIAKKTFYHYINTCRIEEFLVLASLPESRKFTFLALAYECGFNSKTTFNKYFKLQTGKTPSEYLSI